MKNIIVLIILNVIIAGCSFHQSSRITIDFSSSGKYEYGKWKYEYIVHNNGGRWGNLYYNGKRPEDKQRHHPVFGTKIKTPWGPMYYIGDMHENIVYHGWMPRSLAQDMWRWQGKPSHNWINTNDFDQAVENGQKRTAP